VLTERQFLNGGVHIMGATGSGKTSGSGRALARAVVSGLESGGLIIAAKPEDADDWRKIFTESGRKNDLLLFGPGEKLRYNFSNELASTVGGTRVVTQALINIAETLKSGDGDGNDRFWQQQQERLIYNACEILRLATGGISPPALQRFISGAALSVGLLSDPLWQDGFHNQTLKAAHGKKKTDIEQHDFDLAMDYWLSEYPAMADKTRSSIVALVMGLLHVFNTGVVRQLVSTSSNISTEAILTGKKFVLVNMPQADWGDSGRFVAAAWKYMVQRAVLRRQADERSPVVVIWADECQTVINSMDWEYIAQSRSHRGAMVYLTQSISSYYAALKGHHGKNQADALLSNFHTKVFHALGDAQSAEFASNLIGKSLTTFCGGSLAPPDDVFEEILGKSKFSGSFSEHMEAIVQPKEFMHGLRSGGPPDFEVDAIVIRNGEPFANGQNWLRVTFSQK
jgi:hypothetical protein